MTTGIRLSCLDRPRTRALLRGEVEVPGFAFACREAPSTGESTRRLLDLETDAAEMSLATYVQARAEGRPLVAVPVFPARRFLQPHLLCRTQAGIEGPEGLRGRAVGVPQYWMTSSVWHRGILAEVHGVEPRELCWWTTAPERIPARGWPRGVRVRQASSDLETLVGEGRVDCVMLPRTLPWAAAAAGRLRPLFADPAGAARDYFARTGIFPIAHVVAMREAFWRAHPASAAALCAAFAEARARGRAAAAPGPADLPLEESAPDGLAANRAVLETFLRYLAGQGGGGDGLGVEALFAENVVESLPMRESGLHG